MAAALKAGVADDDHNLPAPSYDHSCDAAASLDYPQLSFTELNLFPHSLVFQFLK